MTVHAINPGPRSAPSPGGLRWTSLIGAGLSLYVSRRARRLADLAFWRSSTAGIQRRELRGLIGRAAGTEFGRSRGFARMADRGDEDLLRAYRDAVPLADYEGYRAGVRAMREEGRRDVLWPGLVRNYAQTSGTTAGDKYIPVSDEMLRSNFRASLDIFAHVARFGVSVPRLMGGRLLFLGGSTALSENAHGIKTGDLSGIVAPLIRWPLSRVYSPGHRIALMDRWPEKIEAMARATLDQDIRFISGMPSWTLVLMARVMELARERGLPARSVRDVWPHLTLLVHGGVKYAPFEPRVREAWSGSPRGDDVPHRFEVYPASEGFIAMQDTPGDPGLRLCSDVGIFYEFVPLESIDDPAAPAFTCERVEKGQRYVVVMSTCAGLWRYIIGDVVEFDTIPGGLDGSGGEGPCRLRIVGRHKHFINAFGENIIVEHVENAVARAAREAGVTVGEFTAAPVYPGEGRPAGLELAVECERGLDDPGVRARFAGAFDAAIKEQNVDYTTKRTDNLGMAPPVVTVLPAGAFHAWLASRGKLGGQHKCPRCANHREIISAVVASARGAGR
ncbi:MAG: GH3 auxin-responsive promoter family protein [Phycisphaeraceae bacterium]|nr:MAG: GH3 auxin-responsive promoter family protein [Phycisphaeraceae bacterium]